MQKQKRGISLIVLVITIIVMLVLASAVIITLSNSNIITKAKEAVLKTDVKNFTQELSVNLADKKTENTSLDIKKITETNVEEIKKYIPSFDEKYAGKIFIQNGEVVYDETKVTADEKVALEAIGIKSGKVYTPEEIKAIIESKNLGLDVSTTDITSYVEGLSKTDSEKYTIYEGHVYYRYEKTTYEEQIELYNAGISAFIGDADEDGTLTQTDADIIDSFDDFSLEEYEYKNLAYVCDLDLNFLIDISDCAIMEGVFGDKYSYKNYIISVAGYQHPAKIRLIGDYYLFTAVETYKYPGFVAPTDNINTEAYTDMVTYYPDMTEKQAARFKIVNGQLTYKAEALSEEEKSWADEMDIPYM